MTAGWVIMKFNKVLKKAPEEAQGSSNWMGLVFF